jgi:branched-chain amino acid transport system permease protein
MSQILSNASFILLYGASYGLVLFTIAIGLVITMGLMRVMNLAHGAFAAIGGYLTVSLMQNAGASFPLALLIAIVGAVAASLVMERLFYVHLYKAGELEQVLTTIGLNFVAIGGLTLAFGPNVYPIRLPEFLRGSIDLGFRPFEVYRVFVMAVGAVLVLALWWLFDRTDFGARLRASVDNRGMAQAIGINVDRLFSIAFALGSGLAALGGAIGAPMLPLEPLYPFKYLVIVLVVVSLAGLANVKGALVVAILIGVIDTAGRLLLPETGAFIIYVLLIVLMVWRQEGLFPRRGTA